MTPTKERTFSEARDIALRRLRTLSTDHHSVTEFVLITRHPYRVSFVIHADKPESLVKEAMRLRKKLKLQRSLQKPA